MKNIFILLSLVIFLSSFQVTLPIKTYVENKNIFVSYSNGKSKQLTFNHSDSDPFILSDNARILFIRTFKNPSSVTKKIMIVNLSDLKEVVLSGIKPYKDGLEDTNDIMNIIKPSISLDGQYLYFLTEKYVTSSQLVKVSIKTGAWIQMFPAVFYEEIKHGNYKGCFFIGQMLIEDRGRDLYYKLVDYSGKVLKSFSDKESMESFKKNL